MAESSYPFLGRAKCVRWTPLANRQGAYLMIGGYLVEAYAQYSDRWIARIGIGGANDVQWTEWLWHSTQPNETAARLAAMTRLIACLQYALVASDALLAELPPQVGR